jgi:hypothetical protein
MFANWYGTVEEDTMRAAAILDNTELTDAGSPASFVFKARSDG